MQPGNFIITGADGGLGSVVTGRLLNDGHTLFAGVLHEEHGKALQELFPVHWQKNLFVTVADLSREDDVQRLINSCDQPNGLIHLAGGYKGGNSIADHELTDFEFLVTLNMQPTFLLLKTIVPVLKKNNGGSIVTVGARPAIHPMKGNAVYAATKSAVLAMTLSVAEECRETNVRANCILPATLQTKNNLSWATEEQFKKFTPLEDVAATISFLLSDAGKGITGMAIPMYNKIEW